MAGLPNNFWQRVIDDPNFRRRFVENATKPPRLSNRLNIPDDFQLPDDVSTRDLELPAAIILSIPRDRIWQQVPRKADVLCNWDSMRLILQTLTRSEQAVIVAKYGLGRERRKFMPQRIADEFDTTEERVGQLHRTAIKKIRLQVVGV